MGLREKLQAGSCREYLPVTAFGEPAQLQTITVDEHASWVKATKSGTTGDAAVRFVALCLVDPDGVRVVPDESVAVLLQQPAAEVLRLMNAALAHNKLRKEDQEAIAKN